MARAWSEAPVRQGFAGTLLIALGSISPAYLPQASPIWGPLRLWHLDGLPVKLLGTALAISGVWLLVSGWFRLRPTIHRQIRVTCVLALWSLPFLFAPPIFSHDAYSYSAQGWMLHNGVNPYEDGPGVLPGTFADLVSWVWRYTPSPYGPLSLRLQQGLVVVSGFHPFVAALLMRLPALVGVALIVVLLPRIAELAGFDPAKVAWFACLNPILVIDLIGGCHNDALMMGLVVLALWIACRPGQRWVPAAVVVGVAAAVKQPAFLAAYVLPVVGRPLQVWPDWADAMAAEKAQGKGEDSLRLRVRAAGRVLRSAAWSAAFPVLGQSVLSVLIAAATFAGVSTLCGLGYGWVHAVDVPGMAITISPSALLGDLVQHLVNPAGHVYAQAIRTVGTVLGFAVAVVCAITSAAKRPFRALAIGWLAIAILSPALHSWYLAWGGLVLPLSRRRPIPRGVVTVVVLLQIYAAVNLAWRNGTWAIVVAGVVAAGWFITWLIRARSAGASGAVEAGHQVGDEVVGVLDADREA